MNFKRDCTRREALGRLSAVAASAAWLSSTRWAAADGTATDDGPVHHFRYALASSMYGKCELREVMEQVRPTGAEGIDLWPLVHGNQREQLDEWGEDRFKDELERLGIRLSCLTQYKLGPFGLNDEMALAERLGCSLIVTGAVGPKGLTGDALRRGVDEFMTKMRDPLARAADHGVTIAIENHGGGLMDSAESVRCLCEAAADKPLAIALAPYHLPQDSEDLARLIRDIGPRLVMFYAWQHGMGCMEAQPKEQELLQLPGKGDLDFGPIVAALAEIEYQGLTEIFMHPYPRGVPILDSTAEVTSQIIESRDFLESLWPA